MAKTAVVSSKGQITLPRELRERHHLREGETVLILETKGGVVIRNGRHTLRGLLKGRIDPGDAERALRELRRDSTL
jgi:AbrB family looped-hinge helix DNA binding protein